MKIFLSEICLVDGVVGELVQKVNALGLKNVISSLSDHDPSITEILGLKIDEQIDGKLKVLKGTLKE